MYVLFYFLLFLRDVFVQNKPMIIMKLLQQKIAD